MNLYHFTALHLMPGIRQMGLTRGVTPLKGDEGIVFAPHTQWLTVTPDFDQSWNQNSTLLYDRTACRLSIKVPKDFQDKLLTWEAFRPLIEDHMLPDFDATPDCENWRIFLGDIPPAWIQRVAYKDLLKPSQSGGKS